MNWIELTGIPGSGKSFVLERDFSKNIYTHLDNEFIDKSLMLKKLPKNIRLPLREITSLIIGLFVLGFKQFTLIMRIVFSTEWTFYRKSNVLRNIVKKFAILRLASRNPHRQYVMDEGLYHLNFIFAGTEFCNFVDIFDISQFGIPDIVIVVASEEEVVSRLKRRGHKRISNTVDDTNIRQFVNENTLSLTLLRTHLDKKSISYDIIENNQ